MTASIATIVRNGNEHLLTALAVSPPGTVSLSAEGNVIVATGNRTAQINDTQHFDNDAVYAFTKDSTAYAKGQTVYWDPVNLIPSAAGFIRMGRCVGAALSGDATVSIRLFKDAREAHQSLAAAGAVLTNTTTPTTMGSLTLPGGSYLQAGDKIKIRAQVAIPATNSTDTLQLNLQLTPGTSGSAVNIATTAAVDVANGDMGYFDFELQIRTAGVSGTMVACGVQALGTPGTVTSKPQAMGSSTIDTTQPQILGVQGTWSVANAGDQARLDILSAELIRA